PRQAADESIARRLGARRLGVGTAGVQYGVVHGCLQIGSLCQAVAHIWTFPTVQPYVCTMRTVRSYGRARQVTIVTTMGRGWHRAVVTASPSADRVADAAI